MKRTFALCTTALVTFAGAGPAFALDPQRVAEVFRNEFGYDYVEVYSAPTQTKVEATRGDRTVEVIYDSGGNIVYQDSDRADADERNRQGVEFNRVSRDFLDDDGEEDWRSVDLDDDDDDYDDDDDDDSYDDDDGGWDDDDGGGWDDDDDDDRDDDDRDDDGGSDDDGGDDDDDDD